MKFVNITWVDAGGRPGWFSDAEIDEWLANCEEDYKVVTSGHLLRDTKDYVVLVRGYSGLGDTMDPIRIPKQSIIRITELQEVKSDRQTTRTTGNEGPEGTGEESRDPVDVSQGGNLSDYDSGPRRSG